MMKKRLMAWLTGGVVSGALFFVNTGITFAESAESPDNKNALSGIVVVIGDGVSTELLTVSRVYHHGATGKLHLETFPNAALVRTWSANNVVTDSAAGATAIARGVKAVNGCVGVDKEGGEFIPSLIDLAKKQGWNTGVVSDDEIPGATPASFIAEHGKRKDYAIIASKAVEAMGPRVDLVLGGGRAWFEPVEGFDYKSQSVEIVEETQKKLTEKNVSVFRDWKEFKERTEAGAVTFPVLGVFHDGVFPYIADGERAPRLVEMVELAWELLSKDGKPVMLVVEASLPDKASHGNQAKRAVMEVAEMDAVLERVDQLLDENGLILATTDHSTGGPVFNGYLPLTSKGEIVLKENPVTGISSVTWGTGPGGEFSEDNFWKLKERRTPWVEDKESPQYAQPAAVYTPSAMHSGGDVWAVGRGPGSEKLRGFIENTDIYRIVEEALNSGVR